MNLLKKKCEYCRNKIEKGKDVSRDVRIPGFAGTYPKKFCCSEHADKYEEEVEKNIKNHRGGHCCG